MLKKWILGLGLLLGSGLVGAQTWRETWDKVHQESVAMLAGLPNGSSMSPAAAQDLDMLVETLSQLKSKTEWNAAEVRDLRTRLSRARQRLRISLAPVVNPEAQTTLLIAVERIEQGLRNVEESFDGAYVPAPQEVASSDVDRTWRLPGYESPGELLREARSVRLDVQSLYGPLRFAGAGIGSGFFGGGWGSGFTAADRQRLMQAAEDYELACSRYQDVRQTYPYYRRLDQAFQRVWVSGVYNSLSVRSLERTMQRLDRFYQELEKQSSPAG
jgi:hypothetical protein